MKNSPIAHYLREIVYGGNDGIVTTFAVVAGFSGAAIGTSATLALSTMTVLLFGVANLISDGLSMSLGNYLSDKAEADVYASFEKKVQLDHATTIRLLRQKGFSEKNAVQLAVLFEKNPEYWAEWMTQYTAELQDPTTINPFFSSLATFCSFVLFGVIPLIPFIFFQTANTQQLFFLSITTTIIALILLGLLRWKVTGRNIIRSIGEILFVGGAAACAAYVIGLFFR